MLCPNCGNPDVIVRRSRLVDGDRQRHRGCGKCNARWQTHEVTVEGTLDVPRCEPDWWSRARALRRQKLTFAEIARQLGQDPAAVRRALSKTAREKALVYLKEYRSDETARAMQRNYSAKHRARRQEARA